LGEDVLLTRERLEHILEKHPGVFSDGIDDFKAALAQPDQVRRNSSGSLKFVVDIGSKFLVVVVNRIKSGAYWKIATAYETEQLSGEDEVVWKK
jgi:hypothetical protein